MLNPQSLEPIGTSNEHLLCKACCMKFIQIVLLTKFREYESFFISFARAPAQGRWREEKKKKKEKKEQIERECLCNHGNLTYLTKPFNLNYLGMSYKNPFSPFNSILDKPTQQ
jgi:hypothetical protein